MNEYKLKLSSSYDMLYDEAIGKLTEIRDNIMNTSANSTSSGPIKMKKHRSKKWRNGIKSKKK